MPAVADRAVVLVDSSVAVPYLIATHPQHDEVVASLAGRLLGLSGHAAFETYSVLTRLPPPLKRTPRSAHHIITTEFRASRFLDEEAAGVLLATMADCGVTGGAVYDALVAAAATHHDLRLVTRDRRARRTYERMGVDLEVLP